MEKVTHVKIYSDSPSTLFLFWMFDEANKFNECVQVKHFTMHFATLIYVCESVSWSVVSNSLRPHGLQQSRLLRPWTLQAKTLEWVVIPFSRGSSQPRDQTLVSCIIGRVFTIWATREAQDIFKIWETLNLTEQFSFLSYKLHNNFL